MTRLEAAANFNTAVGALALLNNVNGSENTAVGTGAGPNVAAGFNNTYVGQLRWYLRTIADERQYDPHRRPLDGTGPGPQPASSVVSSTTPSLLAATLL